MPASSDAEILFNEHFAADALRLINPGGWYIGVTSAETRKVYAILPSLPERAACALAARHSCYYKSGNGQGRAVHRSRSDSVSPDLTGTGGVRVGGGGTLAITNPETGKVEQFTAADLIVFQVATALPQEPVVPRA